MDDFTQCALSSPRFPWPVDMFIYKNLTDQVWFFGQRKVMTNNTWKSPEYPSSSLNSSDEEKYNKNARHRRAKSKEVLKISKSIRENRKRKTIRFSSSFESSLTAPSSWNSNRDSVLSNLTRLASEQKIRKENPEKPKLSALQTEKKNYTEVVDYRAYRLANPSPKSDEMVSS